MGTQTQNVTMLLPLPHLGQLALLDRVVVREAIVFLINASVAYVWLLLSPVRPASPVFVIMFSSIPLFISPSISLTISIYLSHYLSLSYYISIHYSAPSFSLLFKAQSAHRKVLANIPILQGMFCLSARSWMSLAHPHATVILDTVVLTVL